MELFGSIAFIAPDILFISTNTGAPKKTGHPVSCPNEGPYLLISL